MDLIELIRVFAIEIGKCARCRRDTNNDVTEFWPICRTCSIFHVVRM
jgi:hypothetical protein